MAWAPPPCGQLGSLVPNLQLPNPSLDVGVRSISPPQAPFQLIGIDHLSIIPRSRAGNRFIIVAVDHLTKWVEVRAAPSTAAEHIVDFLCNQMVLRHGVPHTIITIESSTSTAQRKNMGQTNKRQAKRCVCLLFVFVFLHFCAAQYSYCFLFN